MGDFLLLIYLDEYANIYMISLSDIVLILICLYELATMVLFLISNWIYMQPV
jgi:hypothetical protein